MKTNDDARACLQRIIDEILAFYPFPLGSKIDPRYAIAMGAVLGGAHEGLASVRDDRKVRFGEMLKGDPSGIIIASRRVIQWRDREEGLLDALAEIPAHEERHFDEDRDIYDPLRKALELYSKP